MTAKQNATRPHAEILRDVQAIVESITAKNFKEKKSAALELLVAATK